MDIMFGLIQNLKNKYNLQVQYLHCDNVSENVALLGWTMNILPHVCHNKMALSNENLSLFSTRYMACSIVVSSMLFYVMAYGLKP